MGFIGTIWIDFSRAYGCLLYELLIATLEAYGLDNSSLYFLLDYLSFRKKRTKVGFVIVNGQKLDVEFLKGQY